MTLSARIALRPSRRLAVLEAAVPAVGVLIAASTAATRWPGAGAWIGMGAASSVVVILGLAFRAWSGRMERIFVVSNHETVGMAGSAAEWRVVEPSLVRPGFAVLALASDDRRARPLVVPVVDAAQTAEDRRALHRYLGWLHRGGRRPVAR